MLWEIQDSDEYEGSLLIKPVPGQVVAQVDPGPNQAFHAVLIKYAPQLFEIACIRNMPIVYKIEREVELRHNKGEEHGD